MSISLCCFFSPTFQGGCKNHREESTHFIDEDIEDHVAQKWHCSSWGHVQTLSPPVGLRGREKGSYLPRSPTVVELASRSSQICAPIREL